MASSRKLTERQQGLMDHLDKWFVGRRFNGHMIASGGGDGNDLYFLSKKGRLVHLSGPERANEGWYRRVQDEL